MNIVLLEPFYSGSHKQWARGLQQFTGHNIDILGMQGRNWKWRMHGGAVTLARKLQEHGPAPDLMLASDMLDLAAFKALLPKAYSDVPLCVYFHENQISYPWSSEDPDPSLKRDLHYGYTNFTTCLCADHVFFNSQYHFDAFFADLPRFLKRFPDNRELAAVETIREKSSVLPVGVDLSRFDQYRNAASNDVPLVLWNHRWEYDKNPDEFFSALAVLKDKGYAFEIAVLGECYGEQPPVFVKAKEMFGGRMVQYGYCEDGEEYAKWLCRSDIVPVTSRQDFFGVSAVEAVCCYCYPLFPDRLAFREHLPEGSGAQHLYGDFAELCRKLETALEKYRTYDRARFADYVSRYAWKNMIETYDREFESKRR